MDYKKYFLSVNAKKQIDKALKKYKNKKIVFYGAGEFFLALKQEYDLEKFSIIAISDKSFCNNEITFNEQIGFNTISPQKIADLKADIILITTLNHFFIEKYFNEALFKQTNKKFKYKPLIDNTFQQKIEREWEVFEIS